MYCNYSAQFFNGSHSKLHFYNRKAVIGRRDLGILDSQVNVKLRWIKNRMREIILACDQICDIFLEKHPIEDGPLSLP